MNENKYKTLFEKLFVATGYEQYYTHYFEQFLEDNSCKLLNNKEFMLSIGKQFLIPFKYINKELLKYEDGNNFEKLGLLTLKYASEELQDDKQFVLEIMKMGAKYQAFEYVSEGLKDDKEFVLEVMKIKPAVFLHLSERLKQDKELKKLYNLDLIKQGKDLENVLLELIKK